MLLLHSFVCLVFFNLQCRNRSIIPQHMAMRCCHGYQVMSGKMMWRWVGVGFINSQHVSRAETFTVVLCVIMNCFVVVCWQLFRCPCAPGRTLVTSIGFLYRTIQSLWGIMIWGWWLSWTGPRASHKMLFLPPSARRKPQTQHTEPIEIILEVLPDQCTQYVRLCKVFSLHAKKHML